MGPDGIHQRILKNLTDVTAKPLDDLWWSRESGEFPADLLVLLVKPDFFLQQG